MSSCFENVVWFSEVFFCFLKRCCIFWNVVLFPELSLCFDFQGHHSFLIRSRWQSAFRQYTSSINRSLNCTLRSETSSQADLERLRQRKKVGKLQQDRGRDSVIWLSLSQLAVCLFYFDRKDTSQAADRTMLQLQTTTSSTYSLFN